MWVGLAILRVPYNYSKYKLIDRIKIMFFNAVRQKNTRRDQTYFCVVGEKGIHIQSQQQYSLKQIPIPSRIPHPLLTEIFLKSGKLLHHLTILYSLWSAMLQRSARKSGLELCAVIPLAARRGLAEGLPVDLPRRLSSDSLYCHRCSTSIISWGYFFLVRCFQVDCDILQIIKLNRV